MHCPTCETKDVIKHGKTETGKQRYLCPNGRFTPHLLGGRGVRLTAKIPNVVVRHLC
ncbi:hypothetical protein H8E77_21160 [bacterium]|nr:hypothetical protein [bacterium]